MDHEYIKTEEIIEKYILNRLTPEQKRLFEIHYFECDRCFDEVQKAQKVILSIRDAAIRGKLRRQSAQTRLGTRFVIFRWLHSLAPTPVGTAVALALVLLILYPLYKGFFSTSRFEPMEMSPKIKENSPSPEIKSEMNKDEKSDDQKLYFKQTKQDSVHREKLQEKEQIKKGYKKREIRTIVESVSPSTAHAPAQASASAPGQSKPPAENPTLSLNAQSTERHESENLAATEYKRLAESDEMPAPCSGEILGMGNQEMKTGSRSALFVGGEKTASKAELCLTGDSDKSLHDNGVQPIKITVINQSEPVALNFHLKEQIHPSPSFLYKILNKDGKILIESSEVQLDENNAFFSVSIPASVFIEGNYLLELHEIDPLTKTTVNITRYEFEIKYSGDIK